MKVRFNVSIFAMIPLLLVSGCGSIEYNSTNSPKMVVSVEHTPFFHNGPLQGNGPDLSLAKGDEVEVLRKEIGYSFVRIFDGQNGYVANEALTLVPAPQKTSQSVQTPLAAPKTSPSPVPSTSTNEPSKLGFRY